MIKRFHAAARKVRIGVTPTVRAGLALQRGTRALPEVLIATFFLCSSTFVFAQSPQQQIAARAGLEQKLNAQIPLDSMFRDEHGAGVRLGSYFSDKPVILALVYYGCPNLCTLVLNGILQTAQNLKLDAGKDYEIVIVSFDSKERPALAAAKKQIYLQRYHRRGATAGWHFLTGNDDAIKRLTDNVGYHFAYDKTTRQFAHPSMMIVLTPGGKIARYFPGIEYPARDVRLALIDASQNHIGTLAERLFLLCFHYNPATGKYGSLISHAMQVAGIGSALILAFYIAINLRRERLARL